VKDGRLDLLLRQAIIAESITEVHGAQVWCTCTPRGHERREVPIPRFLVGEMETGPRQRALSAAPSRAISSDSCPNPNLHWQPTDLDVNRRSVRLTTLVILAQLKR
jgi:hypothetical protein